MTKCQEKQADLKAYLDGELPIGVRFALWRHLLRCEKCREAQTAMMDITRRLATGEPETLDPALRSRILASVTYSDSAQPRESKPHNRRPGYPMLLLGGATAAALLVIVLMNGPRGARMHGAPPESGSLSAAAPMSAPAASSRMAPIGGGPAAGGVPADQPGTENAKARSLEHAAPRMTPVPGPVDEISNSATRSQPQATAKQTVSQPAAFAAPRLRSQQQNRAAETSTVGVSDAGKGPLFNGAPPAHASATEDTLKSEALHATPLAGRAAEAKNRTRAAKRRTKKSRPPSSQAKPILPPAAAEPAR